MTRGGASAQPPSVLRFGRATAAREPAPRGRGFTLVEVLVVVLIIGLLAGFVVFSINPNTREQRLSREATRLWRLMSLAADEAVLQSRQIGIRFATSGYAFYVLQGQEWAPLSDQRLRERSLENDFEPEVVIEGLRVVLDETPRSPKPQVMMLSSGEIIPQFVVLLRDRETDRAWRIGAEQDVDLALRLERK